MEQSPASFNGVHFVNLPELRLVALLGERRL